MAKRHRANQQKVDPLEERLSRFVLPMKVLASAVALAVGVMGYTSTRSYRFAQHNLYPNFDESISAELAQARVDPSRRQAYLDSILDDLKSREVGDIKFLGRVIYDPSGERFKEFVHSAAKDLGGEPHVERFLYYTTVFTASRYRAIAKNGLQDTACFMGESIFYPKQERYAAYTDADFRIVLAYHESLHARIHVEGLTLGGLTGKEYLLLKIPVPVRQTMEELLCYHQELIMAVKGEHPVGWDAFRVIAPQYRVLTNDLNILYPHQSPQVQQMMREVLEKTGDLKPLDQEPWLHYEPRSNHPIQK